MCKQLNFKCWKMTLKLDNLRKMGQSISDHSGHETCG